MTDIKKPIMIWRLYNEYATFENRLIDIAELAALLGFPSFQNCILERGEEWICKLYRIVV